MRQALGLGGLEARAGALDLEAEDVADDEYHGQLVDVDGGVVGCLEQAHDAPEDHVDGGGEEGGGHEGEDGAEDVGAEGLRVFVGDGAADVGADFDCAILVSGCMLWLSAKVKGAYRDRR